LVTGTLVVLGNPPAILPYDGPPRKPPRWPWVVIGTIALVSCLAYGCVLTGIVSVGWLVVGLHLVVYVVLPIAAIFAGIKYGTQNGKFWT
jgi:hypothetical protein